MSTVGRILSNLILGILFGGIAWFAGQGDFGSFRAIMVISFAFLSILSILVALLFFLQLVALSVSVRHTMGRALFFLGGAFLLLGLKLESGASITMAFVSMLVGAVVAAQAENTLELEKYSRPPATK
jgi:hypothetical protein